MSKNSITLNVLADITRKINVNSSYSGDKKALIVFTGSNMNIFSRLGEIKKLRENGVGFDIAFSFMSENIIKKDKIVSELKPDNIYSEEDVFDLEDIEKKYSYLIGPNITMNTLTKVSTGMVDSFISTIIWTFLYNGKKVFLDYGAVNNYLGKKCQNKAIQIMIDKNIDALSEMGVVEVTEGNYLDKIIDDKKIVEIEKKSTLNVDKKDSPVGKSKVITAGDIEKLSDKSIIVLEKGDILTPLAKDRAKQMNVEIKINR